MKALVFENSPGDRVGTFGEMLLQKGWDFENVYLHSGAAIPEDWQRYDLLVAMGGPMNVHEEETYPYLREEIRVLEEALKGGLPVLGFCLGAQLMAKALGSSVYKGFRKEIGWYKARLTPDGMKDAVVRLLPETFMAFQWHGDTFELPAGATLVISSENYANQAMRFGTLSYGFQFHFEIRKDMIIEWLEDGSEEIEEMGGKAFKEKVYHDTETHIACFHRMAASFFEQYLSSVEINRLENT
jgi:GMP synthase-like glutamine amidotransferase